MSERRYDEEEVALILSEASEAKSVARRDGEAGGLTIQQLEEIAREVGLDPARVRAAASRVAVHRGSRVVPFFGTPVAPTFERTFDAALSTEDLGELVATIRRVLGRRGIGTSELGAFEWRAQDPMGGRYVSVVPARGGVRLRVFGNFRDGLLLVGMGAGVVLSILFGAVLAAVGGRELFGPGAVLAGALLAALPTRALWRWAYRREEDALAELTEALDGQIRAIAAGASGEGAAPPQAPPSPGPSQG